MTRRIVALLIAIVVIALEIGWHWYQVIHLREIARRSTPPLSIQCPAVPHQAMAPKPEPEPPPIGWHIRRDIRPLVQIPAQPKPVVGAAEGGEEK